MPPAATPPHAQSAMDSARSRNTLLSRKQQTPPAISSGWGRKGTASRTSVVTKVGR